MKKIQTTKKLWFKIHSPGDYFLLLARNVSYHSNLTVFRLVTIDLKLHEMLKVKSIRNYLFYFSEMDFHAHTSVYKTYNISAKRSKHNVYELGQFM